MFDSDSAGRWTPRSIARSMTATIDPVTTDYPAAASGRLDRVRMLVDAHVHLHKLFPLGAFFDHAAANFQVARAHCGLADTTPSCLLLTESAGDDMFDQLSGMAGQAVEHWQVERTEEDNSLVLHRKDAAQLIVVAGRQIVTAERLEVLALGATRHFADGQQIDDVLGQVAQAGAVAVIPWGFGKWIGRRGQTVRRLIEAAGQGRIFLGDNGGRWRYGPRPRLFKLARRRGVFILPGSDPLPFADQVSKPGSFGFVLNGRLALHKPASGILWSLQRMQHQPTVFGGGESLLRFLRAQLNMQIRKQRRKEAL